MNYKETLFFVAKCLTISSNKKNRIEVKKTIEKNSIDWDTIVKISTSHFVFPALYQNLKFVNFLKFLPEDLVNYMEHITELNRERNLAILAQVKEVNSELLKHNIVPIFLKGASFIVEELYNDISERMIGDIDFIVDDNEFKETILILEKYGYKSKTNETGNVFPYVHYPKMTRNNHIAAVEVHRKIMNNKFSKFYIYDFFFNGKRSFDSVNVPSLKNQIIHNCINKQIRDNGKYFKTISLRNSYDLLQLSLKQDPLKALIENRVNFYDLNNYLASAYKIFKSDSLKYDENKFSIKFINKVNLFLKYPFLSKIETYRFNLLINSRKRLPKFFKFITNKKYRPYYFRNFIHTKK
ncbi:MAG: nucleotidyltransferase family protein [Polaribacter sp.]